MREREEKAGIEGRQAEMHVASKQGMEYAESQMWNRTGGLESHKSTEGHYGKRASIVGDSIELERQREDPIDCWVWVESFMDS
jgi:hypothetical protein